MLFPVMASLRAFFQPPPMFELATSTGGVFTIVEKGGKVREVKRLKKRSEGSDPNGASLCEISGVLWLLGNAGAEKCVVLC